MNHSVNKRRCNILIFFFFKHCTDTQNCSTVLTSGFRLLTNKTLCPPEVASPDRPSRLAAAAAAAMPPWPTPRDARALGMPGTDRPMRNRNINYF